MNDMRQSENFAGVRQLSQLARGRPNSHGQGEIFIEHSREVLGIIDAQYRHVARRDERALDERHGQALLENVQQAV